ncbi:hypothetical protein EJ04DRAFT_469014 [Polyplosphaeria fusca]|uniref:Fungal N-terminal domain-containing protein n=1 Tax=Polyplosphaeria fusca TaxID=682080 RepID=A0A9P4QXR9_9PLEO|nr:hypothetical protein EJ04DRAFT_469014 [Polyplosphaeria fusca]
MADPLSIVASAITVAATAASISKALFTIAETLKNAPREIADIAEDISIQSQSLVTLAELIEAHKTLCKPDFFHQVNNILRRFKLVEEELKKLTCNEKRLKALRWFFRKPKAKALLNKIEAIKSSLILELNIIRIAADELKRSAVKDPTPTQVNAPNKFRSVAESIVQASRQTVETARKQNEYNPTAKRRHFDHQIQRYVARSEDTATWLYRLVFAPGSFPKPGDPLTSTSDHQASVAEYDSDKGEAETSEDQSKDKSEAGSVPSGGQLIVWNESTKPRLVVNRLLYSWTNLTIAQIRASEATPPEDLWKTEVMQHMQSLLAKEDPANENTPIRDDGESEWEDEDEDEDESLFSPSDSDAGNKDAASVTNIGLNFPTPSNDGQDSNSRRSTNSVRFAEPPEPVNATRSTYPDEDLLVEYPKHTRRPAITVTHRTPPPPPPPRHYSSLSPVPGYSGPKPREGPKSDIGDGTSASHFPRPIPPQEHFGYAETIASTEAGGSSRRSSRRSADTGMRTPSNAVPSPSRHWQNRSSRGADPKTKRRSQGLSDDSTESDVSDEDISSEYPSNFVPYNIGDPYGIPQDHYHYGIPQDYYHYGIPQDYYHYPAVDPQNPFLPYHPYTGPSPNTAPPEDTQQNELASKVEKLLVGYQEEKEHRSRQTAIKLTRLEDMAKALAEQEEVKSQTDGSKEPENIDQDDRIERLSRIILHQNENHWKRLSELEEVLEEQKSKDKPQAAQQAAQEILNEMAALAKAEREMVAAEAARVKAEEERSSLEQAYEDLLKSYKEQLSQTHQSWGNQDQSKQEIGRTLGPMRRTTIATGDRQISIEEFSRDHHFRLDNMHEPSMPFILDKFLHSGESTHGEDQARINRKRRSSSFASRRSLGSSRVSTIKSETSSHSYQQIVRLPSKLSQDSPKSRQLQSSLDRSGILGAFDDSDDESGEDEVRSTVFWDSPCLASGSELLQTLSRTGWRPLYMRGSDAGQTYFLGEEPVHVNFFEPSYNPQFTPATRILANEHLLIPRAYVEEYALQQLGFQYKYMEETNNFVLDATLNYSDIDAVVNRSFQIREDNFRRLHRRSHQNNISFSDAELNDESYAPSSISPRSSGSSLFRDDSSMTSSTTAPSSVTQDDPSMIPPTSPSLIYGSARGLKSALVAEKMERKLPLEALEMMRKIDCDSQSHGKDEALNRSENQDAGWVKSPSVQASELLF